LKHKMTTNRKKFRFDDFETFFTVFFWINLLKKVSILKSKLIDFCSTFECPSNGTNYQDFLLLKFREQYKVKNIHFFPKIKKYSKRSSNKHYYTKDFFLRSFCVNIHHNKKPRFLGETRDLCKMQLFSYNTSTKIALESKS
jgi:hypothetical protein